MHSRDRHAPGLPSFRSVRRILGCPHLPAPARASACSLLWPQRCACLGLCTCAYMHARACACLCACTYAFVPLRVCMRVPAAHSDPCSRSSSVPSCSASLCLKPSSLQHTPRPHPGFSWPPLLRTPGRGPPPTPDLLPPPLKETMSPL